MTDAEMIYELFLRKVESSLGKEKTNTTQLNKFAKKILGRKWFNGVFPADMIPRKKFSAIICNLDSSDKHGSHWIAIAKKKGRGYMVYDSFGRPTRSILNTRLVVSDTDYDAEQDKKEDNCGQRCIAWLILFKLFGERAAESI